MPGVLFAALHAQMFVLALITKTTAEGAVVKRTTTRARVLERGDLGPFLGRNSLVTGGRARLVGARGLSFGLLEQGLGPFSASFVLPGLG